ncbi:MAG: lycopene cyclase domain-containing protein [Acidimicrobiia bacterium]|nr:lycopene cyclase domain-containing protein [Acidimicrobiia bacterium]
MPPIYPTLAVVSAVSVLALELRVLRTGLLRQPAYWITLVICLGFMIPVDGWLTKRSAPIVTYRRSDTTDLTPIWDILVEEYVYAFAMLTLVLLLWDWLGRREGAPDTTVATADQRAGVAP